MNREERLKTLVGHLFYKHDTKHHSVNHISFMVKPEDIAYILENYMDVIKDSNLYLSLSVDGIWWRGATTDFKVETTEHAFTITQDGAYSMNDNYTVYVTYPDIVEIEITISCRVILSFNFQNKYGKNLQVSFRND